MPNSIENRPHSTSYTASNSVSLNNQLVASNDNTRTGTHSNRTVYVADENPPPYLEVAPLSCIDTNTPPPPYSETSPPPYIMEDTRPFINNTNVEVIEYSTETAMIPPPYTEEYIILSLATHPTVNENTENLEASNQEMMPRCPDYCKILLIATPLSLVAIAVIYLMIVS